MAEAALVHRLLRRPRSLWLWKLNFQVHLWIGLVLTLYLVVIGFTGSILVFRVELERLSGQRPWPVSALPKHLATMQGVVSSLQAADPARRILMVSTPTLEEPFFVAVVQGHGQRNTVRIDPESATVLGLVRTRRSFLDFVAELHTTLLVGRQGRMINGVGAALLLLVNVSGLVIWWPGIKRWKRALTVDLRRSWRRVNFDLHRAVGFWAMVMISIWAISSIYFAWPTEVFHLVNRLSPVVSAQPPVVIVKPMLAATQPDLSKMIASARVLDPDATMTAISFPYSRRAPFQILMLRRGGVRREYTDVLYFNPFDGTHLTTWRYGVNQSLGDWLIWSQIPLHFGTFWGLGVKIVWAAIGITIPLLSITGVLLYWNRVLRHL